MVFKAPLCICFLPAARMIFLKHQLAHVTLALKTLCWSPATNQIKSVSHNMAIEACHDLPPLPFCLTLNAQQHRMDCPMQPSRALCHLLSPSLLPPSLSTCFLLTSTAFLLYGKFILKDSALMICVIKRKNKEPQTHSFVWICIDGLWKDPEETSDTGCPGGEVGWVFSRLEG